ncbi:MULTISPECIES: DUF4249 family protein [unclassified Leeuwenhoekiella]|uniref:DUF4249 family protein n=1 Tax=unclassified Leeuwenhoekiella TaxID=2615029 RepID=UPI000C5C6B1E|nr:MULTISPECIES: DUF4249 family protein [unclassified Leeuwenhoekiella]MAW94646.1 hypothetical protein [Leeuwenhoekiella sp.]MBA82069.1 hypothetical protein [Leeuwenhoekiella sp.]|tara:strand:- start:29342 stop:30151 length:810 start_codon:yes stop_codon:yes gene_type:complete
MKNFKNYISILVLIQLFTSCQETIDVDLPQQQERLVVDALMRIPDDSSAFTTAYLRLTLTADYFADDIPVVADAIVNINSESNTYRMQYRGDGYYSIAIPRTEFIRDLMRLTIFYNGDTYRASARFQTAVPFDNIVQGDGSLFAGDETEVVFSYTDEPGITNYYLFDLDKGQFLTSEDTFYKDQAFSFSYFYEDLKPNDTLNVDLIGINKPFFDYMSIVINQSGQASGNPFTAPPSEIRGNVINATNEANYPLGYFAIGEVYSDQIVIE